MPHYRVYDIKWSPPPADAPADSFDFVSGSWEAEAAVPFHRIIDNTVYGSRTPAGDEPADEIPVVVNILGKSGADGMLTDGATFDTALALF